MKRPAVVLLAIALLAGALLLLRVGMAARDRDAAATLARMAARAQQELELCLFHDREPSAWADHELDARFSGFEDFWHPCLEDHGLRVGGALGRAPNTPAVQAYREAAMPRPDAGMCETALALRRALADLQAVAELDVIEVPAIDCELSGPPLERVAAPAGETMAFVVSREPEVVAYFERDDSSWSHAALRDGAWVPLPRYPERQILFDPASLVAVAAGNPQPVLRHDGKAWREIGRGPRGFGIRALRSTADGGLVAVAMAFDAPRLAILRAASLDGPLKVVATRSLDAAGERPELAIHLDEDGTALVAYDAAVEDGRTLEVSRHAPGDAEIAVTQVGRFEAEGRPSLHACGPEKRWLHRRGRPQEPSSILLSADGGRSFETAGTVPPGGALACLDDGTLLWVGPVHYSEGLRAVRCTGQEPPCSPFEPWVLGGKRAFVSLDGARILSFEPSSGEGLVWTTASIQGLEPPVGVHAPTGDAGLRNLWRMGDRLLVELPLP